jgi:hypothetical protein
MAQGAITKELVKYTLAMVIVVSLALPLAGATYYASPKGDGDDGTRSNPSHLPDAVIQELRRPYRVDFGGMQTDRRVVLCWFAQQSPRRS